MMTNGSIAACACVPLLLMSCGDRGDDRCGPGSALVTRVLDGDTVELADGTKVRYLLVDTPETTGGKNDCFGTEVTAFNRELVLDQEVALFYDEECTDHFGRLLAWVEVGGREVNRLLVERGYACVLYIAPNGKDRKDEFEALEDTAKSEGRGMWGACSEVACD